MNLKELESLIILVLRSPAHKSVVPSSIKGKIAFSVTYAYFPDTL
jgi:hypothetical protein